MKWFFTCLEETRHCLHFTDTWLYKLGQVERNSRSSLDQNQMGLSNWYGRQCGKTVWLVGWLMDAWWVSNPIPTSNLMWDSSDFQSFSEAIINERYEMMEWVSEQVNDDQPGRRHYSKEQLSWLDVIQVGFLDLKRGYGGSAGLLII